MNNIETFLLRLGIRTYSYPVITEMPPAPGKIQVLLGDSLSTELGWIYGISCHVEGVTPKDKNTLLPSLAQIGNLYLTLLNGQTMYIEDQRMSDYVFYNPASGLPINDRRFYPVNIPMTTDLKNSFIDNPFQLSGFSVMTTFHYIPKKTYEALVANGTLKQIDLGIV